jgi:hypothetical protein
MNEIHHSLSRARPAGDFAGRCRYGLFRQFDNPLVNMRLKQKFALPVGDAFRPGVSY